MKKLVLISLLAILTLFLAGCGETVYEETKDLYTTVKLLSLEWNQRR